jgi:hypothetical protein
LELAQHQFDVLLTVDKRIPSQQLLSRYSIGLLIIRARTNRLADLLPLVPNITRLIPLAKRGQAMVATATR